MVYIMLADGFEEIEALTVADILRRGDIQVKTVSVTEKYCVRGAHGIEVNADVLFENTEDEFDMLVLPGGMPGTKNLDEHVELKNLLVEAYNKNKFLAAICAAPMILGKLGLLKGKKATCYPSFENYLEGALVSSERVCVDGNVITSRGPGTASDFALSIVEILKGRDVKDKLYGDMLYE